MTSLEYIHPQDLFKGNVPLSLAVKAGQHLFVSGIPAFDENGVLAAGNFPEQMTQVMANITRLLAEAGAGWDRVAKVNILLTRREDFAEMNRIYATYFPAKKFPARTTAVVAALPNPAFLLEMECVAILD